MNWGVKWSASLRLSSPLFPLTLDVPWLSGTFHRRSARWIKRLQVFPIRDPIIHIPRSLPTFRIPSSPFLDFTQSPFYFPFAQFRQSLSRPSSTLHDTGFRYAQVSRDQSQALRPEPWWHRRGATVNNMVAFWRWDHDWSIHASYSFHMSHKARSSRYNIWGGHKHWIFWRAWA
jgi:hypothetical protein